jgi:hypothetical protein
MADQVFPLEDISRIDFVNITGSLHLSGWNREEIRIKDLGKERPGVAPPPPPPPPATLHADPPAVGDSLVAQVDKKKTILEISSLNDIIISIPHNLEVKIKSVTDDVHIKGMRGILDIKSVSGDLSVSDVEVLTADFIAGDLFVSRIQGNLQVNSVGGDSLIDNVQGQVELKKVGGDIQIDTVGGGIDATAGGSGTADFHPVPWQAYQLKAGGDLILSIPVDTSADLSIKSEAKDITIFPGKLDITSNEKELEHTLGEGGPAILLTAGGKVFVIDNEFTTFTGIGMNMGDLGSIAAGFTTKATDFIRDNLENLEEDLTESLSGLSESLKDIGLSEEKLRELGVQIEETSRMAAEKAEIAAIKAQAKVEKKVAKARLKAFKARDKIKQFDINKFLEAEPDKKAVSEGERMLILEMLQEKKISAEEAEELLNALEGKRP